jgi:hypothetical protein
MSKKKFNIVFKAEAFFNSVVEVDETVIEKFKEYVGANNQILAFNDKAGGWVKWLIKHAEFDYADFPTDIEEIEVEELDHWLQPVIDKPL